MSKQGKEAFDRCSVKAIRIEEYFRYLPLRRPRIVPESELDAGEAHELNGWGARLDCPRTEEGSEGLVSSRKSRNRDRAVGSLRQLAAAALCEGCVYSDMTPQEVVDYRIDLARSEQRLQSLQTPPNAEGPQHQGGIKPQ